jgi:hypothetical protein
MIMGRKRFLALLPAAFFLSARLVAQDFYWDSSGNSLVFRADCSKLPGRFRFTNEFGYSLALSGCYFMNGPLDKTAGQLAFLQSLKYKIRVSSKKFLFTNDLVHNLGLVYYIDSVCKFQTDENTLTSRMSYNLTRYILLTASSILTTRIFNEWDVSQGAGGSVVKTISSSFLTPLVCTFSGGFGFNFTETGTLDVGISSAKLTYINDRSIFEKTGRDSFYGVEKGRSSFLEYGFSLHLLIDRMIGKKFHWDCDLLLFKADKSAVDMTMKSLFAYKINSFLKTSLQTRLFYDEDVSRKLQMENLLSFGFDVHL